MTRTLILMRHAKSSWDDPALDDHDRPLNKRGRRSARALGGWLRGRGYRPDQVLVSSSVRTRETWHLMALDPAPATVVDTLYHATPEQMLQVLSGAKGPCVLMLGHNPGIGMFAAHLAAGIVDHPRFADYPTGATTVMEFDTDRWDNVGWQDATVLEFVIPRELTDRPRRDP